MFDQFFSDTEITIKKSLSSQIAQLQKDIEELKESNVRREREKQKFKSDVKEILEDSQYIEQKQIKKWLKKIEYLETENIEPQTLELITKLRKKIKEAKANLLELADLSLIIREEE